MNEKVGSQSLWSVILAGGEGQRMRPLVEFWLGCHTPKQYCTFVGTRSLFQHTLDRAQMLGAGKCITVVDRSHKEEVSRQLGPCSTTNVVLQPANRGTVAGVFLPLTYVRAQDPQASVAVFPSDHFVFPEQRFIDAVRSAARALETLGDRIVLLGATPDHPQSEYGWLVPGSILGWWDSQKLRAVSLFLEKPDPALATLTMQKGGLWSTLVFAAKVETVWNMGRRCFPRLVALFEELQSAIGSSREEDVLREIYEQMPARDFSSDLLARVTDKLAVIELQGVLWSDWGRPERIMRILNALGKRPAFFREPMLKAGNRDRDSRCPLSDSKSGTHGVEPKGTSFRL